MGDFSVTLTGVIIYEGPLLVRGGGSTDCRGLGLDKVPPTDRVEIPQVRSRYLGKYAREGMVWGSVS